MEYQALYRKYRPQRFEEVIGQDHVTRTLAHEITEEKVAHAYLFAGPRGTGKTTTARLLAKALNCADLGADGEPCTTCVSCVGVAEGTSLDVIELDAASHNKVEDIREIRVNVGTVAVAGTRRVYILDEAHMLSRAASNALLKTLEEPPEHVIFVLATTEPYKLLDTIRSRAQRFDFHPVPAETLVDYLALISEREGFEADRHAMTLIAGHALGSVRDAMSLLEQVAALGGGSVEAGLVTQALGLADQDAFARVATAISEQDAPAALALVAELASQGADLRRFVGEAVGFFRGVFLAQYSPNLEEVADEPLETLEDWRRHAAALAPADVLRAVDQLSEALLELRQGREERLVVELTLIRLARPETSLDAGALQGRLDRLEARVRELANQVAIGAVPEPQPAASGSSQPSATIAPADSPEQAGAARSSKDVEPAPPGESAVAADVETSATTAAVGPETARDEAVSVATLDLESFESAWPAIVAKVRQVTGPRRHAFLKEAVPSQMRGSTVVFEVPAHLPFHLEQLQADDEVQRAVVDLTREMTGAAVTLEFVGAESPDSSEPTVAPDRDELLDQGDAETDPTALVVDMLGGEVIGD